MTATEQLQTALFIKSAADIADKDPRMSVGLAGLLGAIPGAGPLAAGTQYGNANDSFWSGVGGTAATGATAAVGGATGGIAGLAHDFKKDIMPDGSSKSMSNMADLSEPTLNKLLDAAPNRFRGLRGGILGGMAAGGSLMAMLMAHLHNKGVAKNTPPKPQGLMGKAQDFMSRFTN